MAEGLLHAQNSRSKTNPYISGVPPETSQQAEDFGPFFPAIRSAMSHMRLFESQVVCSSDYWGTRKRARAQFKGALLTAVHFVSSRERNADPHKEGFGGYNRVYAQSE